MVPQQEILRTIVAASIVALHLVGGEHPFVPSATTAFTVGIMQLISLLQTFVISQSRKIVKKMSNEKTKEKRARADFSQIALFVKPIVQNTAIQVVAVSIAGLVLARTLRSLHLLDSPLETAAFAFVLGGFAHMLVKGKEAVPTNKCHQCCKYCGSLECSADDSCPYHQGFWAELPPLAFGEEK